jgi:hypothetical protein
VTIGRFASSSSSLQDRYVYLIKGGVTGTTNRGATSTNWPTSEAAASYGSTSDLWGTSWTPADINASNFGVALTVDNNNSSTRTANVDYINVTVTYQVPLPIQLSSFTVQMSEANDVRLEWNTVSEVNNYGFYVERRGDEEGSFSELANAFVAGNGTTLTPQSYSYVDNTTGPGVWYYRLRQVDLDGTVNYTDPVRASKLTGVAENAPREFALMQNYPNPFNPSTEVKFSVATTGHATLDVYNMLGQKVATLFNGVAEAGKYYGVKFDATQLASGTYMYRLQSADKSELKKMMLVR